MDYTIERQAREYIRALLGDRPYMVVCDGVYFGYSPEVRAVKIVRYYCRTTNGVYYTDKDELEEETRKWLREEYRQAEKLASGDGFRKSPWYAAVTRMAAEGFDWSAVLPDRKGMKKEAVLVSARIRDIEADSLTGRALVKMAGGTDPEEYLKRKAPWLTSEAAMKRMAEKL